MTTRAPMRPVVVLAVLLVLTLLVRLPFFFPAVIDWDESTFVLIGQSILDGHLPYTELWDVKPPLLFGVFGGLIGVFGHSIAGVRIAGALLVALTAWLTFLIAARRWPRSVAWLAAILTILTTSLIASGQATMSEHVMLPFLMAALWLLLDGRMTTGRMLATGALVAAASLVRLNVVYTAAAIGLVIVVRASRRGESPLRPALSYVSGGLAVVALVALPFVVAGQAGQLWNSVIGAGLARAAGETPVFERIPAFMRAAFETWTSASGGHRFWIGYFVWIGMAVGLGSAWLARTRNRAAHQDSITLAVVAVSVVAGILMSGGVFHHYLIQLAPLSVLLSVALVADPHRAVRGVSWITAAGLALMSLQPVGVEYKVVQTRFALGEDLPHGRAYSIAAYLERENPQRQPILVLTDHIIYWLVRATPPTPYLAHPSTLSRSAMLERMGTTPQDELLRAFERSPLFVVIDPRSRITATPEVRALFDRLLAERYEEATVIEGRTVYRLARRPGGS